jgi:hypothetical protein
MYTIKGTNRGHTGAMSGTQPAETAKEIHDVVGFGKQAAQYIGEPGDSLCVRLIAPGTARAVAQSIFQWQWCA